MENDKGLARRMNRMRNIVLAIVAAAAANKRSECRRLASNVKITNKATSIAMTVSTTTTILAAAPTTTTTIAVLRIHTRTYTHLYIYTSCPLSSFHFREGHVCQFTLTQT